MSHSIEQLAKSGKLSKLENLSPIAIQQLRILASEVNDGFIKDRALMRGQNASASEMADLRFKLDPLLKERDQELRLKEAHRNPEVLERVNPQIQSIERRMQVIGSRKATIMQERESLGEWLRPTAVLLDEIRTFMRAPRMEEFFPEMPNDSGQVF